MLTGNADPFEVDPAHHEYPILASDEAYRGRILAVRVDDVEMPGGRTAKRDVVEHFGAVAIAGSTTPVGS
jgi:ADP-ribose pyrophosphatase